MYTLNQPVQYLANIKHPKLLPPSPLSTKQAKAKNKRAISSYLDLSMGSFIETIQKRKFLPTMPYKDDLPVSQSNPRETHMIGIRKRISSFSIKIQPLSSASSSWAFKKSKSLPSIGEFAAGPFKRWWDWSWGWLLSRKLAFAKDLEMNEEESSLLGFHGKGSLRHILYKVRSEIRKLVRSETLPTSTAQRFSYDSFNYVQNFDDRKRQGM